MKMSTGSIS